MGGGPPWCCCKWSVIFFFSSDLHQPVLVGLLLHGCAGTPAYSFPLFRAFFVGAATTHAGPRRRPKATCLKIFISLFCSIFIVVYSQCSFVVSHFVSLRRRPGLRSSTTTGLAGPAFTFEITPWRAPRLENASRVGRRDATGLCTRFIFSD